MERRPYSGRSWIYRSKPKDIDPLIFEISKRRKWSVMHTLSQNHCSRNPFDGLSPLIGGSMESTSGLELQEDVIDEIVWFIDPSGQYSAKSEYEDQYFW
jgi:hypothetical protein